MILEWWRGMLLNPLRVMTLGIILWSCSFHTPVEAQFFSHMNDPEQIQSIVGIIQGRNRNTIDILDELEKRTKRFVYMNDSGELKIGDKVRVYYYPRGYVVQNIKKMTGSPAQEGQNQGYLFKGFHSDPAQR